MTTDFSSPPIDQIPEERGERAGDHQSGIVLPIEDLTAAARAGELLTAVP